MHQTASPSLRMAERLIQGVESEAGRLGVSLRETVASAGIHWTTWLRWRRNGPSCQLRHLQAMEGLLEDLKQRKRAA